MVYHCNVVFCTTCSDINNCVTHNFKDAKVSLAFSMMLKDYINKIVMISTVLYKKNTGRLTHCFFEHEKNYHFSVYTIAMILTFKISLYTY